MCEDRRYGKRTRNPDGNLGTSDEKTRDWVSECTDPTSESLQRVSKRHRSLDAIEKTKRSSGGCSFEISKYRDVHPI